MVEELIGEEVFISVDGAFGGGFDSTELIDKGKPLIERAVGKFDFQLAHGGGAEVGAQNANAKSGAHVGDEMFETAIRVLAFGGIFAPLFKDRLEDELVKTAAGEEVIDQFEFDPVFAVIFCRIDDKRSWTKWDGVAEWGRQNGDNWLR